MSQTAATDGGERFNSIGSGEAQLKQRIRMDGGSKQKEMVTLGGGCFWCTEAIFEQLKGVEKVESGYSGGSSANPTYKEVCSGTTGHAEVVEITFDPKVISLKDLLRVFFLTHDPTTLNRQGDDVGTQYRSVIFYRDEAQKQAAQEVIQQIRDEKIWDGPIVTELAPFKAFYKAEDYHQGYFRKNPQQGYCRAVIAPKVAKVREKFRDKLKDK
jgi:peptide-methionine (S)-S-oxide reductase